MELKNIEIVRIIMHEVVKQSQMSDEDHPFESTVVTRNLDTKTKSLINERLIKALSSGSHCVDVSLDPNSGVDTFENIVSMLSAKDTDYIRISKNLAHRLSNAQIGGSIKTGTAVFLQGTCTCDDYHANFIAVIKAESDKGLRKSVNEDVITLEYFEDLLFSGAQRLIKIAFITEDYQDGIETASENIPDLDPENYTIKVYDHLMSNTSDRGAAAYFYKSFLGCDISSNAATTTKNFLKVVQKFISQESTFKQTEKQELHGALIAYLRNSNNAIIEPGVFARSIFPLELQDPFVAACASSGITGAFSRDISKIASNLKKRSIKFSSDVILCGSPEVLSDTNKIKISNVDNEGWTVVQIFGHITE